MIGLAEILVVAVIVLLILVSGRRGDPPARAPDVWEAHARIRIPRHLVTIVGAVAAAVVAAFTAVWMDLPAGVGTVATGLVAGIAAAMLANRGSAGG